MDRLSAVLQELRSFVAERDWGQFHDPKNLAMALASETGELLAEYRWVANSEADRYSQSETHRERISGEAADIGIMLFLFCDRIGLDLCEAMRAKIEVNRRHYPTHRSRGLAERPDESRKGPASE